MTLKVLHVFSPSLRTRFGGQNVTWKYNFSFWNEPGVEHYCLEVNDNQVIPAKIAFDFDYPEKQIPFSQWDRGLWTIKLIRSLRRVAKEYDVVHYHILWWGSLLSARWAKRKKIPTIYESVLLDADTPGNILKESFGRKQVSLLKDFPCILTISDYLAQDYLDNGFCKDQVVTLMNSVDTTLFHPLSDSAERADLRERFGLPADATILIFVGSIIHRKGVDVLVEAFKQLSSTLTDAYLLLVGPQTKQENPSLDENWVGSLKENLAEAGLTSKVKFFGLVSDRQRLADLYRASDIFVFPSRQEGLGNVILEAMASGLPVIVSDLPVFEGVVQPGVNGVSVPVGKDSALTQATLDLINNPQLAEKYGNKAREDAVQQFSFSSWQDHLVAIYKKLMIN